MNNILLVEDDLDLAELTSTYLQGHGYQVETVHDGLEAVEAILSRHPEMVILDIMLPGIDGMEVCRRVRDQFSGPIMMLTARDDQIDQILGLEIGADAYLSKAAEPRLVVAQVKALLRRPSIDQHEDEPTLVEFDELKIRPSAREVTINDVEVELTNPEYDLLLILATHAGRILSRDDLFNLLRGVAYDGQNRLVDITISQLRNKLKDAPKCVQRIKTVRNKGYLFAI